jgi:phosphate transport system substrate-binding protein
MNIFRCLFWVPLMLSQAVSAYAETATGAGSSAAAPIYRGWAKAYSQAVGHAVEYESIGSSAGMKKIQQQAVGFGATDVYPSEKDLAEHGLLALPVAITGIAPVVNLPKMQGVPLRLTGDVLSRIFMGEITRVRHQIAI